MQRLPKHTLQLGIREETTLPEFPQSPRETHRKESLRCGHLKVEAIDLAYPGKTGKWSSQNAYARRYMRQPSPIVTIGSYT